MHLNRIRGLLGEVSRPTPAAPTLTASSFVICPSCLVQGAWQQQIYEAAFAQACAVANEAPLARAYQVSAN